MNMNVIAAVAGSLVVGAASFVPMGAAVGPDPLQVQSETAQETLATDPAVTDESLESTVDAAATDAPLVVPSFGPGEADDDDDDEDEEDEEDDDDEDDEEDDEDEDEYEDEDDD
jgi:hypothetical protein